MPALFQSLHCSKLVTYLAPLWIPNNMVCGIVKCFFPVIIIPLIQFSSLARPINFLWHLSKWSKWNDWFLSFVQCVRHYVTYVGSLPYLEPIIWWVGRQPTSGEIRVLKRIGGEKHGWCLHSIWQKWTVSLWMGRGGVALNDYSLQDPNKKTNTQQGKPSMEKPMSPISVPPE